MDVSKAVVLDGQLKEEGDKDLIMSLGKAEKLGWKWNPQTCRLSHPDGPRYLRYDSPWIHNNEGGSVTRRCTFDQAIVFGLFNIISPRCLRCWKTCLKLKDYDTTRKMEEYQKTFPGSSKCGMEKRNYTPRMWGAYFYRDTFDGGRDCVDKLNEELPDVLGEDNYEIILKRGCTEFELLKGPSLFWYNTPAEEAGYEKLCGYFADEREYTEQPVIIKNHIRMQWIAWAHACGDMSYMSYNNDKPMFPKLVYYHEGDRDKIKQEMATCLEQAKIKDNKGEG
jgi:hypothetical protein